MTRTKTTTTEELMPPPLGRWRSELAALHTTTEPELRRALQQLPAWREAVAGLHALTAACPEPEPRTSPEDAAASALVAAALAGQPPDVAQVRGVLRSALADEAAERALTVSFAAAFAELGGRLDQAVRTGRATLYATLDAAQRDILAEARQAPAAPRSVEDALDADQVPAWRDHEQRRARFVGVRRAAANLASRLDGGAVAVGVTTWAEVGWLANPEDVWPDWAAWRRDGALVDDYGNRQPLACPFPSTAGSLLSGDASSWFDYLVTRPEAVAWVPSPDQYAARCRELGDRMRDTAPPARPISRERRALAAAERFRSKMEMRGTL